MPNNNIDKIRSNRPALVLSLMCKLAGVTSTRYNGRSRTELATLLDQYFPAKDLPPFTLAQLNEHATTEARFAAEISESTPHAMVAKRHAPDGEVDTATAEAVAESSSSAVGSTTRQILDDCDELMRRMSTINDDDELGDVEEHQYDIDDRFSERVRRRRPPVCNLTEVVSSANTAPATDILDLTSSDTPPPSQSTEPATKRVKTASTAADSDTGDGVTSLFHQYDGAAVADRQSLVAPTVASSSSSSSVLAAPQSLAVADPVLHATAVASSSSSLSAPLRLPDSVVQRVPTEQTEGAPAAPSCASQAAHVSVGDTVCVCGIFGDDKSHNTQPPFYYWVGDYNSYPKSMLVALFSAAYTISKERNLPPATKFKVPGIRVVFYGHCDGQKQFQRLVTSGVLIYDYSLTHRHSICPITRTPYQCPYLLNLTGQSYSLAAIQNILDQTIKIGKPLVVNGTTILLPEHASLVKLYPNHRLHGWNTVPQWPSIIPPYDEQPLSGTRLNVAACAAISNHLNKPSTRLFSAHRDGIDEYTVPALQNVVIEKAVIGYCEYGSSVAANCLFNECIFFMHALHRAIISRSKFKKCIFILPIDALQKGFQFPRWPKCIYETCAFVTPLTLTAEPRADETHCLDWIQLHLIKDGKYSDTYVHHLPANHFSATALRMANVPHDVMYARLRVAIGAEQAPADGSIRRWKLDRANNKWLCEPAAQN